MPFKWFPDSRNGIAYKGLLHGLNFKNYFKNPVLSFGGKSVNIYNGDDYNNFIKEHTIRNYAELFEV